MKRVSFEIAKVIKEAGYPQDNVPITEIGWYNIARVYTNQLPTYWEGDNMFVAVAPTYLEVWLWLWREKGIYIDIAHYYSSDEVTIFDNKYNEIKYIDCIGKYRDPEEAIIKAIEYLVNENLLK